MADTNSNLTGFDKFREIYNKIHKGTTIDQKKDLTNKINLFFKKNNYNLKELQDKLKLIHKTSIDHPENFIEIFLICKDAYEHAVREIQKPEVKKHYEQLFPFLDCLEKETDEIYSIHLPHAISNKNHYRRELARILMPYKAQTRQFIIFSMKDTILLSDKALGEGELDESKIGKEDDDSAEETSEEESNEEETEPNEKAEDVIT